MIKLMTMMRDFIISVLYYWQLQTSHLGCILNCVQPESL